MNFLKQRSHILLLILYAVILVGFSQILFISESEFWPWNVGYNLRTLVTQTWVWDRPLFYGVVSLATFFGDNVWQTLLYARALSALWCSGLIAVTGLFVWQLTGKKYLALFAGMLLMANTTFVSQAYRIRSDTLAMLFVLSGLLMLRHGRVRSGWAVIFASLLVTPKAVLFVIPVMVWLLWNHKKWRIPALIGVGVLCGLWFWSAAVSRQSEYVHESLKFYSFSGNHTFVKWQFQENWWFWLLSALFLILKRPSGKVALIYVTCLALLILYPEPYQFYIAALLPAFVILLCYHSASFFAAHIKVRKVLTAMIFIMSIGVPLKWYIYSTEYVALADQLKAFLALDNYLEEHNFKTLYDGVGAFPHRMFPQMYTGPGDTSVGKELKLSAIENSLYPDVIIFNGRLQRLGMDFVKYLNRFYVEVQPLLYMKSFTLHDNDFVCEWGRWRRKVAQEMIRHGFLLSATQVIVREVKLELDQNGYDWKELEEPTQKTMRYLDTAITTNPDPNFKPNESNCHWRRVFPVVNLPSGPFSWQDLYRIDN